MLGCGESAHLPVSAGIGPTPNLPEPSPSLIPVIKVVDAKGWPHRRSTDQRSRDNGQCVRERPEPSTLALRAA